MTIEPSPQQADVIGRLDRVLLTKEANEVESALIAASSAGLHPGMAPCLILLAEARWHTRHEDVVSYLQILRSTAAVDSLERVAQTTYPYFAYDDFDALARKCTWALADIGNPAARAALERLALSPKENVANYALKRLARWNDELHRKGPR